MKKECGSCQYVEKKISRGKKYAREYAVVCSKTNEPVTPFKEGCKEWKRQIGWCER